MKPFAPVLIRVGNKFDILDQFCERFTATSQIGHFLLRLVLHGAPAARLRFCLRAFMSQPPPHFFFNFVKSKASTQEMKGVLCSFVYLINFV